MKKIIALALAIALLLGCTVAFAESTESHPTPHISTFAKMHTYDNGQYITITLDKAVDKLFVQWHNAGGKIVPEELAVAEINGAFEATALKNGHKYMPGTTQYYNTRYTNCELAAVQKSEIVLKADAEELELEKTITQFGLDHLGWKITQTDPTIIYKADAKEKDGIAKDKAGNPIILGTKDGVIKATKQLLVQVVVANPGQEAYITLQGDWVVSYNRAGTIVKIVYNDGIY